MMKGRHLKLAVLGVACTAAVALAGTYRWIGEGQDHDWDTCDNWTILGLGEECYPSTQADDATIPYVAGGWTVNLINVDRMDDLTIAGDVTFQPAQPSVPVSLKANSLTICGGESTHTVVEVTGPASIVIEDPNSP
jgi:hypothetical protein